MEDIFIPCIIYRFYMNCYFCAKLIINGKIIDSKAYCDLCLQKHQELKTGTVNTNYNYNDPDVKYDVSYFNYNYLNTDPDKFHNY